MRMVIFRSGAGDEVVGGVGAGFICRQSLGRRARADKFVGLASASGETCLYEFRSLNTILHEGDREVQSTLYLPSPDATALGAQCCTTGFPITRARRAT